MSTIWATLTYKGTTMDADSDKTNVNLYPLFILTDKV